MRSASENLLAAYRKAIYRIVYGNSVIEFRVDKHKIDLDSVLANHNVNSAALITAFNPQSNKCADSENQRANEALLNEIKRCGFQFLPGEGTDPEGEWDPEPSFFVLGITQADAMVMAANYGQAAFVFTARGEPPRLIGVGAN